MSILTSLILVHAEHPFTLFLVKCLTHSTHASVQVGHLILAEPITAYHFLALVIGTAGVKVIKPG